MSKPLKQYTKEEKLEIVKLSLDKSQRIKSLADRFEISEGTIYRWRKSYLKYDDNAFPGKGNPIMTEAEARLAELERENKELRLERDILKKAVGIFSRTDRKFTNL